MRNKFHFGQKVHCWWYNSWFFRPPKPCTVICKLPYKGSYYPYIGIKEQFWLVKVHGGFLAGIPEKCMEDLKEKVEREKKNLRTRPTDEEQAKAYDTLKMWNDRDANFLNS